MKIFSSLNKTIKKKSISHFFIFLVLDMRKGTKGRISIQLTYFAFYFFNFALTLFIAYVHICWRHTHLERKTEYWKCAWWRKNWILSVYARERERVTKYVYLGKCLEAMTVVVCVHNIMDDDGKRRRESHEKIKNCNFNICYSFHKLLHLVLNKICESCCCVCVEG